MSKLARVSLSFEIDESFFLFEEQEELYWKADTESKREFIKNCAKEYLGDNPPELKIEFYKRMKNESTREDYK